jgi:hypothetical protein
VVAMGGTIGVATHRGFFSFPNHFPFEEHES